MGNQEFGARNRWDVCSHACLHE